MPTLELVSLSSRALKRDGDSYDLVFDLSSKPLPAFSAIDCWRRRTISPLRDRVMIEWLFSHYEAEIILETMTTSISKTLKEKSIAISSSLIESGQSAPSSTLLVAVACQSGAQHSVCFVEKLNEQYSFESPIELDGVKVEVKRKHSEATKGEWLNTKDAVWQHSRFPVKSIPHHRDLVLNRAWSNFPLESARQLEAEFHQDPVSDSLDIGKHIVNFERGILCNKKSQEEFRIRSTIPSSDEKVQSSWLQDDEYRQLHKSYTSAGILFYSIHPRTGEAVFLLGHMTYGSMAWCDFGGLRKLMEKARYTAARECYEETMGILGKTRQLASMLENYEENNVFKIMNEGTRYVGHFLRVPYKDYPTAFEKALEVATGDIEVDEMKWFSLSSLRSGIQKALLDQYDLKVEPLNEDGNIDHSRQLPLRFELVHSLCIADQLGVLKSIEHIARTLHAESQPPPPPYVSYPIPRRSYQESMNVSTNSVTTENTGLETASVTTLNHHPLENLKVTENDLCLEEGEREQGTYGDVSSGNVNKTESDMTLKERDLAEYGSDSEGESCDSRNRIPLQSQTISTGLESEIRGKATYIYVERDGRGKPQPMITMKPKSDSSNIEQKASGDETQETKIDNATNNAVLMFGIGAGTFMY